jgi:L-fuculose-phosphate aldolase
MKHLDHRLSICEIGRWMYEKGWVASNDGNISVRLGDGTMLATPTRISKGRMQPEDLIVCDMDGRKLEGNRDATSEIAMHVTVYRMRPDITAVVHAHPPVSTGFAVAGRPLTLATLPEVIVCLGCVPLASYGLPGTDELTEGMKPFIPKYDALLMANHGAVCYGESLENAYYKMETLEHFARISLVAELLGGPKVLPREEVAKLFEARERYGVTNRAGMEPGYPVVAEDLQPHEEKIALTRAELISLVDEVLRARS